MSELGRFQSLMAGAPRLLGGPPPAIGTRGAAGAMSPMTPNFFSGNKRGAMGSSGNLMNNIVKLARSATLEGAEVTQTHDSPENQPIVAKRKIASNAQLYSQESNLQYFMIWVHPAVDEYRESADFSGEGLDGYRRRFLVDSRHGTAKRDATHTQTAIGGRTTFLYWHISLAEMNFILQSQETRRDPKLGDHCFAEAMADWKYDGVINNKKHNSNKFGTQLGTGDDAHVTVDQYSLSHAVNYWGLEAVVGVRLFLIHKRVDRKRLPLKPNRYVLGVDRGAEEHATPEISSGEEDIVGADKLGLVKKPFQILPWARRGHDSPPLSELEYVDNQGIRRIASYSFVGTVHRGSSKITKMAYYQRARYDDFAAMRLPRIWIFLAV